MRIVHVIPALTKGGAEKVLVDLANEARRRGHDVTVINGYPADPRLNRDRLEPSIPVKVISASPGNKLAAYAGLPLWLWRNRDWLDQIDIVHCHLTFAAVFGSLLKFMRILRGRAGPKIIETFHGVGMPIRLRQRWLAAALARGRDGFALMAEDAYWNRFLLCHPVLPSAIIPNGLAMDMSASPTAAQTWRESLNIPREAMLVGTIGRIRAERNPLATLQAFASAARALPDLHFLMAGDGPMTETVRQEADRLRLGGRLHLPGLVVDPALALANIDLYLSMNVGPVTGIAGLEAAASGVPVIALQARDDYRTGHHDWMWSDSDPQAVGDEIVRLLHAPEKRAELGTVQRNHVAAHYSVQAAQNLYEALYARALR